MDRGLKIATMSAVLITLAGCGAGADTPEQDEAGNTKIVVGTSPTISNVSLYQAIDAGYFDDVDLSVTPKVVTSGQQAVPLLLNGQIHFTAADPLGALVAISQDTPLTIVAGTNYAAEGPDQDTSAVVVADDSPIESAADLAGSTVAVNALRSLSELSTREAIRQEGGDDAAVKFTEMPLPQMLAAVADGTVDAAVVNEPLTSEAAAEGFRTVLNPMSAALAGTPQLVYVVSTTFADENPELVEAFVEGIEDGNAALAEDPELTRTVAETSTETPKDVLAQIALPIFEPSSLSVDSLARLQELMLDYDYLDEEIDLESVAWSGAS